MQSYVPIILIIAVFFLSLQIKRIQNHIILPIIYAAATIVLVADILAGQRNIAIPLFGAALGLCGTIKHTRLYLRARKGR